MKIPFATISTTIIVFMVSKQLKMKYSVEEKYWNSEKFSSGMSREEIVIFPN